MALAPVAYCLWQHFLRFDPQDPIWPNRDRFVLSIGHASMLLYSLLHLTEVQAVGNEYETLGEPAVPLDALKAFRQLDSRCPGASRVPMDLGGRDHHRAARPGGCHQRRHGHGPAMAERPVQPSGVRKPVRLQCVRPVRRWLHDGGYFRRGRFSGGASSVIESLLDLRQQPHHDRRRHCSDLYRRRGYAVHRLRLECNACR